jgi:hypothetical protein
LTSFSYKTLPRSLRLLQKSESEIISVLNAGLHLIREDIPFEGEKVYVTIPNEYCKSVIVPIEADMTENDGWELSLWSIKQRWHFENSCEYFGRSFEGKTKSVFATRVSTIYTEIIKLAIQELGGEPLWMGSESSAFFALNPDEGCTVFHLEKNGYRYFHFSKESFENGKARYINGKWKLNPIVGSTSNKEVFQGRLIVAGKLSNKRKANFKGHRIKQMIALEGISIEGNIIPKKVKEEDLYTTTAIATGTIEGVALNFFDSPGLQQYRYEKTVSSEKPKAASAKKEKKKTKKVKRKVKRKKKKINILKPTLYMFFFMTIGIMLTYDQKPEFFDFLSMSNLEKSPIVDQEIKDDIVAQVEVEIEKPPIEGPNYFIESQSLISTVIGTFDLLQDQQILLLSISDGQMDLEIVGNKTMDISVDTLGDVLNYSLRQVNEDKQFKHGYLVNYGTVDIINNQPELSIEKFQSLITDMEVSFFKVLDPIERGNNIQNPIIVQISGVDKINQMLSKLYILANNVALEKFVYTNNLDASNPTSVFYISLYFLNTEPG